MTNAELLSKIKAEIERRITDNTFGAKLELIDILAWLDTLESEKPTKMEEAVKWLVDDDYHEASEKGRFILGSVGLGYNGYYIPYLDLLKLPKEG